MMPDITSSQYSLNLWFLFKSFLKMNAGAREKAKTNKNAEQYGSNDTTLWCEFAE